MFAGPALRLNPSQGRESWFSRAAGALNRMRDIPLPAASLPISCKMKRSNFAFFFRTNSGSSESSFSEMNAARTVWKRCKSSRNVFSRPVIFLNCKFRNRCKAVYGPNIFERDEVERKRRFFETAPEGSKIESNSPIRYHSAEENLPKNP